jgi:hypothetical protein
MRHNSSTARLTGGVSGGRAIACSHQPLTPNASGSPVSLRRAANWAVRRGRFVGHSLGNRRRRERPWRTPPAYRLGTGSPRSVCHPGRRLLLQTMGRHSPQVRGSIAGRSRVERAAGRVARSGRRLMSFSAEHYAGREQALVKHHFLKNYLESLINKIARCLVAARFWDQVCWALEAYAWRFDGCARPSQGRRR